MRFAPLLLLGLCAACGGSSSPELPPPSFRQAPGWVILEPGPSEPNLVSRSIVAMTAAEAETLSPFAPFEFEGLQPDGVIVWATTMGYGETGPTAEFPRSDWPLELESFRVDRGWEMQPAPEIQQRLRWVVVDDWHLEVRIYFGTQHPTPELLAETQAQLHRLVLPHVSPRMAST